MTKTGTFTGKDHTIRDLSSLRTGFPPPLPFSVEYKTRTTPFCPSCRTVCKVVSEWTDYLRTPGTSTFGSKTVSSDRPSQGNTRVVESVPFLSGVNCHCGGRSPTGGRRW